MEEMEWTDLMVDNGELIRIQYPVEHMDDFFESIDHAMKRRDWWSPNRFDGCRAEYLGISLDRVNMSKVIGML